MKRGIVTAVLVSGISLMSAKADVTSVRADSFSKGSRNATLWSIQQETNAVLVESTGQLHFITEGPGVLELKAASWMLNYAYPLQNSFQTESTIRVRLPHLVGNLASESTEIVAGVGWRNPTGTRNLYLDVIDNRDGRYIRMMKIAPNGGFYLQYPVPVPDSVIDLRLLFKAVPHTVSIYWKLPGESTWTQLGGSQDLLALWDVPETVKVIPFIRAQSFGIPVYWSYKVTLDNFKTTTYSK